MHIHLFPITEKFEMIFPPPLVKCWFEPFCLKGAFIAMHILEIDKEQSCHDRESVKADPFLTLHVACLEMLTTVLCVAQLSLDIIRHLWRNRYKRKRWVIAISYPPQEGNA